MAPSTTFDLQLNFLHQSFSADDVKLSERRVTWPCSSDTAKAVTLFMNTLGKTGLRAEQNEVCSLEYILNLCGNIYTCLDQSALETRIESLNGDEEDGDEEEDEKIVSLSEGAFSWKRSTGMSINFALILGKRGNRESQRVLLTIWRHWKRRSVS